MWYRRYCLFRLFDRFVLYSDCCDRSISRLCLLEPDAHQERTFQLEVFSNCERGTSLWRICAWIIFLMLAIFSFKCTLQVDGYLKKDLYFFIIFVIDELILGHNFIVLASLSSYTSFLRSIPIPPFFSLPRRNAANGCDYVQDVLSWGLFPYCLLLFFKL